ncbi:MAG: hypothetical protein OXC14_19020 [Rhodospirillaceae bacterium]|nr:hypothetical protein [Rhodospirillaceae bacterium]
MLPYALREPKTPSPSLRLVGPNDIDSTVAIVEGRNWAATVQHIENDWKRPVKRTTLVWDGADWGDRGDGFEPGRIRRRAIIGPLVENTLEPPFFSMTLDEIRIDRVKSGTVWGTVTASSGPHTRSAGHDQTAGRDVALDFGLSHCAGASVAECVRAPETYSISSTDRRKRLTFALVNRAIVLAFNGSKGPRKKGRTPPLIALRTNLGEALYLPGFEKYGERTEMCFENGISLDDPADPDHAGRLREFVDNLPLVTAVSQRSRLTALISAIERAGLPSLASNPRLAVNVMASDGDDLLERAESVLIEAGTHKRRESGWLSARHAPDSPWMSAETA